MTALETACRRQQADIARLSLSVPRADDPELAENALWNDAIAADLEELPDHPAMPARRRECPCGLAVCFGNRGCPCGEMAAR